MGRRKGRVCLVLAGWLAGIFPGAAQSPTLSPATTRQQAGLVDIQSVVKGIDLDMRYFGSHNFVGRPITGYLAPRCWLKPEAAAALARVELALRRRHQRLRIFDCYRPARAVAEFVRWMADPTDLVGKAEFYPGLDKSQLSGTYIAPVSGHSRGATVDLTILQCNAEGAECQPLDMGTPIDATPEASRGACCFDAPNIDAEARARRHPLASCLEPEGIVNYPTEWWHWSYGDRYWAFSTGQATAIYGPR